MAGRTEKTVFISYRRTNIYTALAVYQNLIAHGYDVFVDYQSIDSGDFEKIITENIKARAHFVVILSPSALERCNESGDWLRREIEIALDQKRNIVPLMMEGFDFSSPATINRLQGKLELLRKYNGLRIFADYFEEGMDRLRNRYLSISLESILHPVSSEVSDITKKHNQILKETPLIEERKLSAQEWFEKGFLNQKSNNFYESIRCYEESIRLDPEGESAYNNLGKLYGDNGRYTEAENLYRKAIKLDPLYARAYFNLSNLLLKLDRGEDAEKFYRKAVEIDSSLERGEVLDSRYHYQENEEVKALWE